MASQLQQATTRQRKLQVLAIDLEAHHIYSFHELVCLIQLAGGGRVYLVDALALHDHLRQLLGPLLEDARNLKLLHGGRSDVGWLRGLGMYLVNVLDTCELATVRSCP